MITITVVTCTYNAGEVLERTLKSVAEQDYSRVEHLIIDGCSRDATLDMCHAYKLASDESTNGHSVVIMSEPDKGLYDAMNKGLLHASGDYLVYLNAGDVFPDGATLDAVASSVGEGEKLPGVIYGDTDVVDSQGHFIRHRRLSPPEKLTWRSFRHGMLVCHQAFYALTSIARANPYNINYRYSADVDWCIRVMKQSANEGRDLKNTHRVVAHFLDGGMTTVNHRASLKERFQVMCSHYGFVTTVLMHLWFVVRGFLKK